MTVLLYAGLLLLGGTGLMLFLASFVFWAVTRIRFHKRSPNLGRLAIAAAAVSAVGFIGSGLLRL